MRRYLLFIIITVSVVLFSHLFSVISFRNVVGQFSVDPTDKPITDRLSSDNRELKTDNRIHPLLFYDEQAFLRSTTNAKPFISSPLGGGIIPHHLVASDNIANFFKTIQPLSPSTLVLIGPNHYEKGNFDVLTSLSSWDTPNGIVSSNAAIIQ